MKCDSEVNYTLVRTKDYNLKLKENVILNMKTILTSVVCILCVCMISVGCKKDNVIQEHDKDGNLIKQYEVDTDSLIHGLYLVFRSNGDTLEQAMYTHGKLNGKRAIYYPGNQPEQVEYYEMDSLSGSYQVFHKNGQLQFQGTFIENKFQGEAKSYYDNGALKEEVLFVDNEENGPFIEYYQTGGKKWEGEYKNGDNEIGLLLHFAENGDTIKKMECDDLFICRTFYRNEKYPEDVE